jgi:hypothetical protein
LVWFRFCSRSINNVMKYCHVKNNEIIEKDVSLPVNWENVSNFYVLPNDILKTYGWIPYEKVSENKPIFVSSSLEILEDKVVETFITRDKTQEELNAETEQEIINKWTEVREQRNELLKQSDILVLIDNWESLSLERQNEIRNYRQALREIPQTFQSPFEVVWPSLL